MGEIVKKLELNIYGINSFINKLDLLNVNEESLEILNLDFLKQNFKLDYNYDEKNNQITKSPLPAFTQLTYNERITDSDNSYSESYNRPPLGPIDNYCYCIHCNNIHPEFHAVECPYPEKKSLYLTVSGIFYFIIRSTNTFSESITKLRNEWINKTITQNTLNGFLIVPNSFIVPEDGDIKIENLNNTYTNIQYFDIIKLRGPNKLEYTTATSKFNNTLMLSYEFISSINDENDDETNKKTSIRIYKNGLINLINVPKEESMRTELYNKIIKRINEEDKNKNKKDEDSENEDSENEDSENEDSENEVGDSVNIDAFNEVLYNFTGKEYDRYEIIDELSFIHSVNSQFNLWQDKQKYEIDFNKLNNIISPFNADGYIVSGEFTNVQNINNRQIINLNYDDETIKIINWEHSTGRETRIQTKTREQIKCYIIPTDGIKISLQIHKHGTFQMSMSYCNSTDVKNKICNKVINKLENPLDFKYFYTVQNIFVGIFQDKSNNLVKQSLFYTEDIDTAVYKSTVSGKAPPKQPGTSTEVCRSKHPTEKFSYRPSPYSFAGKCSEDRLIINPIGVLGNDGLYYPCCSAKTSAAKDRYNNYIKNGFPQNKSEEEYFGVNKLADSKSGILKPGSTIPGAKTRALINGEYKNVTIVSAKGKSQRPQEFLVQVEDTNNIITVNRQNLEKDSRYFPGLRSLNKEQLIKCILNNITYDQAVTQKFEMENLAAIDELIDVLDHTIDPSLNTYDIDIFTNFKYYVTNVPNNTNYYYLYISKNETFFINNLGNKITKSFNETIDDTIILFGFLSTESTITESNSASSDGTIYYVTDLLYFNREVNDEFSNKIEMLKELESTYFSEDSSIIFSEYSSNIIKSSKDLLQEYNNISLVFIPNNKYSNFKIWNSKIGDEKIDLANQKIILQVIKKKKTNYYSLGFENKLIKNKYLNVSFDDIFIPKKFRDEYNVDINDYVLFKFDYNVQTNELSTRTLIPLDLATKPKISYNETLIKISNIINPIKESFFINNQFDNNYVWSIPNNDTIFKYVNETSPLEEMEEF